MALAPKLPTGLDDNRNRRFRPRNSLRYNLRRYLHLNGIFPDVENPHTFCEKIWVRMLFDRRPILAEASDKLQTKRLAKKFRIPCLPALSVHRVPITPDHFDGSLRPTIVKANHGSGWNYVVSNRNSYAPKLLYNLTRNWLASDYSVRKFEWAYSGAARRIFIEPLIFQHGRIPDDVSLFCFRGLVRAVCVTSDRWQGANRIWFLDPYSPTLQKRYSFDIRMLAVAAAKISDGFDFLRVDFLALQKKFFLNELTVYPSAGINTIIPEFVDRELGKYWTIEDSVKLYPNALVRFQRECDDLLH
ncbi:ATP-grasp fold amidoligase family protein [Henriciella marina]|uniref:ATP-grasp fold amidoligase family protein n=1 Tax=Henriciella marina TaxID=453851 RepID=UPI000A00AE41|nr:ATP-grasp fold amidoligase family protein [Henriciella marina]